MKHQISLPAMAAISAFVAFSFMRGELAKQPRVTLQTEMQVKLPLFAQVGMAGGDRYLAADMAVVRALVVSTAKMAAEDYPTLAGVQQDAAWLNPAHEDNYYIAAAILPWEGQVDAAQDILKRASLARPYDYQPTLFYAFGLMHFKNDFAGASAWMRQAAESLPNENDRLTMQNLAARLLDKVDDLDLSIRIVENMAKQSKRTDFKQYLMQRVERLRALKQLRVAEGEYVKKIGKLPAALTDLVKVGLIESIPKDPFGFGFELKSDGQINLRGPDSDNSSH